SGGPRPSDAGPTPPPGSAGGGPRRRRTSGPASTRAPGALSPAGDGGLGRRLGDVAELLGLSQRLELLERLVLDLADALAGDVEGPPDLVQRPRVLAAQAVAQLEHAALAV